MDATPFDTAALRARVIEAWAASASRFREDANAEEDAALGAYRDRLLVELLQNAVDAAAAAGVPAKVHIRLTSGQHPHGGPGGLLEVANTGAPLTAAGVEALSTLRASAKRDVQAVGRFGAGFAAVLAVTDTPSIVSRAPSGPGDAADWRDADQHSTDLRGVERHGVAWRGVEWSRRRTADLVVATGADALRRELDRRAGAVPVLRLPFDLGDPASGPGDGFDTVVRLPLRDTAAAATARELIAAFDPTLPLVLPGLEEIVVEVDGDVRTHRCVWEPVLPGPDGTDLEIATVDGTRWRGCVHRGSIPSELLADRPVEERDRTTYNARVMIPDGDWPAEVAQVVRAPQPTDEAVGLPALISVDLPLDPSRRHTVPGPLRDWLTDRLADTVVALAAHLATARPDSAESGDHRADGGRHAAPDPLTVLDLVPTGLPRSEVDGRLRDRLLALLPDAPVLPGGRRGRDCLVLDLGPATDAVTDLLRAGAETGSGTDLTTDLDLADFAAAGKADDAVLDGLLPAEFATRRRRPALDLLGVRRLDTGAVVEVLRGMRRTPSWWAGLYPLLLTAPDRDALGALPVPVVVVPDGDDLGSTPAFAHADPSTGTGPDGGGADPATPPSRMVTGPRGALLPTPDLDVVALARSGLPLRVVHPDACAGTARDVLRTLGASEGTPAGVLRDPAVREAVTQADPDDDPGELDTLAAAVLALVRAIVPDGHTAHPDEHATSSDGRTVHSDEHTAHLDGHGRDDGLDGGGFPSDTVGDPHPEQGASAMPSWLGGLLLPEQGGGFAPASELVIADGPLDRLLAEEAPFGALDPRLSTAWPDHVLEAVGVLRTFGVLYASDVTLDPDEPVLLELDDSDTWADDVHDAADRAGERGTAASGDGRGSGHGVPGAPRVVRHFAAVRDLELVDPDTWPEALAELARPPLRRVVLGAEPSYTRWWLARHALLPVDGDPDTRLPPGELVLPGADPLLTGLFAPGAPLPGVDPELLRRLGCRLTLDDVLTDPDAVVDLLDRLGDADREIGWPAARTLYMAAVSAAGLLGADPSGTTGPRLDPPLTVRTPTGVFRSADVVVVDAPDLLEVIGADHPALRLPLDRAAEAAHILGLRLASELADFAVLDESTGLSESAGFGGSAVLIDSTVQAGGSIAGSAASAGAGTGGGGTGGGGVSGVRGAVPGRAVTRTVMVAGNAVVVGSATLVEAADTPDSLDGVDLGAVPGAARPLVARYQVHPELWISSLGGGRVRVPWRVVGGIGGEIHVDAEAGTDALARALAWRAGQWERRHGLAAALRDPDGAGRRQAEDDLDDL
ncbi:molecular chaperone Hsp90 [Frankia sp. Mgl5]|uniref:sacsin N-terminal ATP-binding-like domain-containing protein n=1 Tax=Frankia sp. Mgl5 TaxID=2933793 RepID=UPI00200E0255|nr:molecular chaperone Hsp90 [Frankia sp. Mgl5]MCK9930984.1 molecular chaperone Hsp90 [Frankia sp. Mgl5]